MENLFKGLECFGFKNIENVNLYENKNSSIDEKNSTDSEQKEVSPDQFLYYKTYTCPICEYQFSERAVRRSKLKLVSSDFDLKPNYYPVDPIVYDVIICKRCGYTALSSFFGKIWGKPADYIRQIITPEYKSKDYPFVLSIDDGIERNKLALYNAFIKKAKNGEKAYICMRLGWLYRDKGDKENEKMFLKASCDGFIKAYSTESEPVSGLGEHTMAYIIACFLKISGNESEALKWLSQLIVSKSVPERVKQRSLDLKQLIQKERESKKGDAV